MAVMRQRRLYSCGNFCAGFDAGKLPPPGSRFAGVGRPPVGANRVAGAGEPLLVAPELFQRLSGKEFRAVAWRMAERFQEARCDQQRNLFRFEPKKPRGLGRRQACGKNLLAQEFNLPFLNIHTAILSDGEIFRCITYTK